MVEVDDNVYGDELKCKYCYSGGEHCPLLKKLTEQHKTRYVDCEETDEEME